MPSGDSRLTDWDMPEANEHQQIESSVNHRIVMEKKNYHRKFIHNKLTIIFHLIFI